MSKKKVLITAGSTTVPIDKVRAITNIFKGKTGTQIAQFFDESGYDVTLITSSPEKVSDEFHGDVIPYKTYDNLFDRMEEQICNNKFDIIIHSAAVSDYKVEGVYIFNEEGCLVALENGGKVSSKHKDIYFRCTQTQKIVDLIKGEWGFKGYLVKFKLEVAKTDAQLLEIARKSREDSNADMIVANCLEWSAERAYTLTYEEVDSVPRNRIAKKIEAGYEYSIRNNG